MQRGCGVFLKIQSSIINELRLNSPIIELGFEIRPPRNVPEPSLRPGKGTWNLKAGTEKQ